MISKKRLTTFNWVTILGQKHVFAEWILKGLSM